MSKEELSNKQLNSIIWVLREWGKNTDWQIPRCSMVKFHKILIDALSKYRKIDSEKETNE